MLTQKQRDLLLFINERMQQGSIAPSFDEMREALGLKSKSGIHRLITALVERGYLERLPHRARALEIKRLPEGYENAAPRNTESAPASLVAAAQMNSIPLYGRIAAGSPIEAIRDENGTVDLPPNMMGSGEHYALEVDGDSMIKAGIHDGDTVIIKKTEQARDGEIVVALVDGEEVTLKRLKRDGGKIVLLPENDEHEPQVYTPEQVQIQGVLASLMRTYH
ncbi:MAG: transcriptional repressor LexA [Alphaproteobacteria bacterium]|nr:transcriptional repressor LexA [Alphaproteobacteria bacterium]